MDAASAIDALQRQKQRGLELSTDAHADSTTRQGWYNTTSAILAAAFGPTSSNIGAVLSAGPHHQIYFEGTPQSVIDAHARENLRAAVTMLDSCIEQLQLLAPASTSSSRSNELVEQPARGSSIFIVHGADEGKKEAVARFLNTLDLEPIILHEQANLGRTLIEKFEAHAAVSFAVVILTGDDWGGRSGHSESARPRGRQNVVFELGYFVGRLGRKRVCTLYEEGVEIPSDLSGIVYVPLDPAGAWRTLLARELKAAGFQIDMNRAL